VKRLIFRDVQANRSSYVYLLPDSMKQWALPALRDYMAVPLYEAAEAGFLPHPQDELRHESFRRLITMPASTLNQPVVFLQGDTALDPQQQLQIGSGDTTVMLERDDHDSGLDLDAVDVSQRNLIAFSGARHRLVQLVDRQIDFETTHIRTRRGARVESITELLSQCSESLDNTNLLRLLFRIARVVHAAPFENFSRILDGSELRSGYEMWDAIDRGYGGVCVEKTAALRFVCDILGIRTSPVLGSGETIPQGIDQLIANYITAGDDAPLPIWIQHHLLEIHLPDSTCLIDVTNGNIPLLMADGPDTARRLQAGLRARLVYNVDRVNLRRVEQHTGDLLLTLGEYQVPDLQLQYIFEQGLGLHISDRAFLGVYFDWGGERSQLQQNYYTRMALRSGFPLPRFLHAENLNSCPDESMQHLLEHLLEVLRTRYDDPAYTGDFTFVLQPLEPTFWTAPRISESIRAALAP
jgi:hypothetical protein